MASLLADELPGEWELFDLEKDLLDLLNLSESPAYRAIILMVTDRLDAKMSVIGDVPEHEQLSIDLSQI